MITFVVIVLIVLLAAGYFGGGEYRTRYAWSGPGIGILELLLVVFLILILAGYVNF